MVSLNCLVYGDERAFSRIFDINVSPYEKITSLRQEVWEKLQQRFGHISVFDVVLYTAATAIRIADEDRFEQEILNFKIDTEEGRALFTKLNLTLTVSDYDTLAAALKGHLHILVVIPESETVDDVYKFILSQTFPSPRITPRTSKSTCPFSAIGMGSINTPYYVAQDASLSNKMYEDLERRVLRGHTLDDQKFKIARAALEQLRGGTNSGQYNIDNESWVCKLTDQRFIICTSLLLALRVSCTSHHEVMDNVANVGMDRLYTRSGDGLLAWEEKSPLVFQERVTLQNIKDLCGPIETSPAHETGFRGMVFKLVFFMIARNVRWGVLHGGEYMCIFTIEKKGLKPIVIISDIFSMAATNKPTPLALICYMLLTGADADYSSVVNPEILKTIPNPIISRTRGSVDKYPKKSNDEKGGPGASENYSFLSQATFPTNAFIIHLPALDSTVQLPMMGESSGPQMSTDKTYGHLVVGEFIGAGRFGRTFMAEHFQQDQNCFNKLIVKLANYGCQDSLRDEARAYYRLNGISTIAIPQFYGLFRGTFHDTDVFVIVMSYEGRSLESYDGLSLITRLIILSHLIQIHRGGVEHNDMKPEHVVENNGKYRLIDFSVATVHHECLGPLLCEELRDTVASLKLSSVPVQVAWFATWLHPNRLWISSLIFSLRFAGYLFYLWLQF